MIKHVDFSVECRTRTGMWGKAIDRLFCTLTEAKDFVEATAELRPQCEFRIVRSTHEVVD